MPIKFTNVHYAVVGISQSLCVMAYQQRFVGWLTFVGTLSALHGCIPTKAKGMKRLNARGLEAANKMLLLSAAVYNLKKWLRFTAPQSTIKTMAFLKTKTGEGFSLIKNHLQQLIIKATEAMQILLSPAYF